MTPHAAPSTLAIVLSTALSTVAALTVAGCGASAPQSPPLAPAASGTYVCTPPVAQSPPPWAFGAARVKQPMAGLYIVAVENAEGPLARDCDVVQDLLTTSATAALCLEVKSRIAVSMDKVKGLRSGELRSSFDTVKTLRCDEMSLYGLRPVQLYEPGDGRVFQLWHIDSSSLRRTFIGANVSEELVDEMVQLLSARGTR